MPQKSVKNPRGDGMPPIADACFRKVVVVYNEDGESEATTVGDALLDMRATAANLNPAHVHMYLRQVLDTLNMADYVIRQLAEE